MITASKKCRITLVSKPSLIVPKILLIEDDMTLCDIVVQYFQHQQYRVECAHNGEDAIEYLSNYKYDAVILDWNIPGMDGIEVLRKFRSKQGQTPVLMLTGHRDIADKELGLDSGADDYLTKPFDIKELAARLRALMRRPSQSLSNLLRAGTLTLNPKEHKVWKNDVEIRVPPREFQTLEFLMSNPSQVFSIEELLKRIWTAEDMVGPDVVRTSVKRLRQLIDEPDQESIISTIYGVGYKLDPSRTQLR
ncbi:response regulator transcription factor [soil metagenome]